MIRFLHAASARGYDTIVVDRPAIFPSARHSAKRPRIQSIAGPRAIFSIKRAASSTLT